MSTLAALAALAAATTAVVASRVGGDRWVADGRLVRRGLLGRVAIAPAEVRCVVAGDLEAAQHDVLVVGRGMRTIGVDLVDLRGDASLAEGLGRFLVEAARHGARVDPSAAELVSSGGVRSV